MKVKYVLDASALLVLINEEAGQEKVLQYLPESCISAVNFSEVAAVLHTIKMPTKEIEALLHSLVPEVANFDQQKALRAAELRNITKEKDLSLGDRACLALGEHLNVPVITADTTLDTPVKIIVIR